MIEPQLRVIGVIRTRYTEAEHTPIQASLNVEEAARVELDDRYAAALDGLDEFSHAWLLTWLGGTEGAPPVPPLRQVPFLLRRHPRQLGILATRGPRRPNPIGLSLVRLTAVERTVIRFLGVDMVDGTPLLDVKPYVSRLDSAAGDVRGGWFDTVDLEGPVTPAELDRPFR